MSYEENLWKKGDPMREVYNYLDYQEYLRDFYDEQKEKSSWFSYRYMGNKIDLDPSFLVKVLQGKMNLSIKSIPRVAQFCGLEGPELEYFETLVRFGRAKTAKENKLYFDKLIAMSSLPSHNLTEEQYAFYSKWYHLTVRQVLQYYDWKEGYAELGRQLSPRISAREARESIELLKKLDLIATDENGNYKPTDKIVTTGDSWRSAAIHSYQKETIELAKESLDRHPKEIRDISSITISVNHKDLEEIRRLTAEYRKSLLSMKTGNGESDAVYQVNIQVIPTTEIGE